MPTKTAKPSDSTKPDIVDIGTESSLSVATIHRWNIPGSSIGYELTIDVAGAPSVEVARATALTYRVGTGIQSSANDSDKTRPLNSLESNWIATTEPLVVRDAAEITLDHDAALYFNRLLKAESDAVKDAKKLLESEGVDVSNPRSWVDGVNNAASKRISTAQELQDRQTSKLSAGLVRLATDLDLLIQTTGFAPAKPAAPSEPDYSALSIVVSDLSEAQRYPRLSGANWIETDPRDPLSGIEEWGLSLLLKEGGLIDSTARSAISNDDMNALRAIEARIKAIL